MFSDGYSSEPQRDVEEEGAARWVGRDVQVVSHRRGAQVRHLGIQPRVLLVREQVARAESDFRGPEANARSRNPRVGQRHAYADLTQFQEGRVLDVRRHHAFVVAAHACCVLRGAEVVRRRCIIVQELCQVDDVAAVLIVEHDVEGERLVRNVAREAHAIVRGGVSDLHIPGRPIAARVERAPDELGQRLADLDEGDSESAKARERWPEGRQPSKVLHFTPELRVGGAGDPQQVSRLDWREADRRFDTAILNLSAVEDLTGEPTRRRGNTLKQQIRRVAIEARQLPRQTVIERNAVDADLDLLYALRRYVLVPGSPGDDDAGHAPERRRAEGRELLAEHRQVARLSVRDSRLDLASLTQHAKNAIRTGDLGKHVIIVNAAVHAAALGA